MYRTTNVLVTKAILAGVKPGSFVLQEPQSGASCVCVCVCSMCLAERVIALTTAKLCLALISHCLHNVWSVSASIIILNLLHTHTHTHTSLPLHHQLKASVKLKHDVSGQQVVKRVFIFHYIIPGIFPFHIILNLQKQEV